MTTKSMDGGAIDPRLARVLLLHCEAIAQATERAVREMRALALQGVDLERGAGILKSGRRVR